MEIAKGHTLVIRGATSALGRAALNIAVDAGAHVIATTRKKERFEALKELGAHRTEIETPNLSEEIPLQAIVDKAAAGVYKAKPARVFRFEDIREAHKAMELNLANGKMVVRI